jgi:hypothetical protein
LDWQTPTGTDEELLPDVFNFAGSYPNPFNARTNLRYSLEKPGFVTISIFDIQGRKVADLIDGNQAAGQYTLTWDAGAFPSGVYFARLESGNQSQCRKIVLLK